MVSRVIDPAPLVTCMLADGVKVAKEGRLVSPAPTISCPFAIGPCVVKI